MRLTRARIEPHIHPHHRSTPLLVWVSVLVSLAVIFWLDGATASAPLQHLYYVPIIIASLRIGRRAGLATSVAAVALYHMANPVLHSFTYTEADIVQVAIFIAVGVVTARLADDTRRLRKLAATDDLTGLHNLRSFEAQLAALVRTARDAGTPLSMLVLDVDRLKSINDVHGHLAGAEAVRTVGHVLAARLPPDAVACRYGGDEFAIALPGYAARDAEAVANDLRQSIAVVAPVLAGVSFAAGALSISLGVATLGGGAESGAEVASSDEVLGGEALFKAADRALYLAKSGGRNRVSVAR
jgi:diguanylate cyclase (GGDEF)-like protein